MIKVIKPGRIPEPMPKRVDCPNCRAELEYAEADVQCFGKKGYAHLGRRPEEFIVCPECGEKIVTRAASLEWNMPSPRGWVTR